MAFNLATTKRQARQALHGLAGVAVTYTPPGVSPTPVVLTARWHNKTARPVGDLDSGGYAEIIAGIDRLVFNQANLDAPLQPDGSTAAAVRLKRTGQVRFDDYDITFSLDVLEPSDGPLNVYWSVVRL